MRLALAVLAVLSQMPAAALADGPDLTTVTVPPTATTVTTTTTETTTHRTPRPHDPCRPARDPPCCDPCRRVDETQTVLVTTAANTSDKTSADNADSSPTLAKWLLVFGVIALGLTLLYLHGWQESWTSLAGSALGRTGSLPDFVFVSPVVPDVTARGMDVEQATLEIEGPLTLPVNQSGTYRVRDLKQGDKPTWSVDPEDAASVSPASGPKTTLKPTREGPLALAATTATGKGVAQIAAVRAQSAAGTLPLVGVGYGGVVLAIVAVTVASSVTALGLLDGAALATLLGTVVAYFFAQASGRHDQQAPADDGQTTTQSE
jgi:hypothetical protein